ncbi:MAG: DUF4249 family protein [Bacteroidales bacterium]|jgi:hypothetical protein|nr:DUF4249 family protein [Bacteroidales bacterium]
MKIRYYSAILLFAGLLCASCVETIYPESVEKTPVVVNCVLDTSDTQSLYLAYSSKVSEVEDFKIIDNADAVLREIKGNDTVTVATFSFESDGMWRTNFRPVGGKEYQLLIEIPGQKRVTATTRMPQKVHIIYGMGAGYGPVEEQEYLAYAYQVFITHNTLYLSMSGKDDEGNVIIANNIATDHTFADLFNITGDYYAPDTSQVHVWYTTVVNRPFHKRFIRIPDTDKYLTAPYDPTDETITTKWFTVFAQDKNIDKLSIMQVSDELDAYYKDVITFQNKHEVTDNLLIVYDRTNVYSNLTNAIGIFGAYNKYILPWSPKQLPPPPRPNYTR